MRKKIVFMVINMNIGGTEKALLNMINEIPKDQYEITIFMLEEYGEFLKLIPSEVKVEYFSGYQKIKNLLNMPPQFIALDLFKKRKRVKALTIFFLHIITRLLKNRSLFFKYILRKYPTLSEEYDVAIAYDGPMDFISFFVLKKMKAKKKIQWIHFDVSKTGFNKKFAAKVYSQFDKVFVVSKEARKKFLQQVPTLKGKTETFINIFSWQMIQSQLKNATGFTDHFDGLRILTVGRLSFEKGQDLAIRAFARLVKDGYQVRWYCVGEGNLRREYEYLIQELHLEENFILLGSDPNPYPYIDQCDIYVQPSRHEGYCISLMEARFLKKPIITTCFTGAKEQINHGETGLIIGINEDEIYNALVQLINDGDLRKKFTRNLALININSQTEMIKIFDYVG